MTMMMMTSSWRRIAYVIARTASSSLQQATRHQRLADSSGSTAKGSCGSVGIDLKELGRGYGSDVEMFEILHRDWNLKPIFTQK